mmetsp:Transcript_42289/g.72209  ORF Transcript_42289/g.72209 Transcript_42289/m.72209 type:complete len:211 (+) Transcript_42289:385-1017(+)
MKEGRCLSQKRVPLCPMSSLPYVGSVTPTLAFLAIQHGHLQRIQLSSRRLARPQRQVLNRRLNRPQLQLNPFRRSGRPQRQPLSQHSIPHPTRRLNQLSKLPVLRKILPPHPLILQSKLIADVLNAQRLFGIQMLAMAVDATPVVAVSPINKAQKGVHYRCQGRVPLCRRNFPPGPVDQSVIPTFATPMSRPPHLLTSQLRPSLRKALVM